MGFDFELALVLATLVCGLIWGGDALLFAGGRRARSIAKTHGGREDAIPDPTIVEYARSFFPVLLIVLVVRSFLAEPFRIPSESMLPTLEVGDFIVVNKFSYGVRLPVTHTQVLELGRPERGDVVVFRYPRNPSVNYIKRIVGLPGDQIAYYNRRLFVNGEPVPLERLGPYVPPGAGPGAEPLVEFREQLGEMTHAMLLDPGGRSLEGEFVVPESRYFVLGDNRDHSNDSRRWGYVPAANLVGEAEMIWMHWDWNGGGVGWSRIGNTIQ
ncbi:MAG: signal peptidase I [Halofilum sp. (in: g-proteobacteria)]|nr:signal peptidase I [Halofilum sp. (in: g-proteobacteria)]